MRNHEHVNATAAKWIAEGWEPTCQDDYEWATDAGPYALDFNPNMCPRCGNANTVKVTGQYQACAERYCDECGEQFVCEW